MRRKYNLRKIVSKRCYTTEEIAELFQIHVQTVRTWRKEGLQSIENTSYPYLFLGSDIRSFLKEEMDNRRVKLAENELYCLHCNKAVIPQETKIIDRNVTIGKGKQSVFIIGNCPDCGLEVRRFATKEQLRKSRLRLQKETEMPQIETNPRFTDMRKEQISLFETDDEEKD